MNTAQSTALAFLMTQQASQLAAQEEVARLQAENARLAQEAAAKRAANPKPKKERKAEPRVLKVQGLGFTLPERGTLDAAGFVAAIRRAGRRLDQDGHPYTDQRCVREDTIKAIHAFYYVIQHNVKVPVGFDIRQDFGAQERAAMTLAQQTLNTGKKLAPAPSRPSNSLRGFVAGLPDETTKKLEDLRGRYLEAVSKMIAHEKEASEATSQESKLLSEGMAQLEQERARAIMGDIQAMGFEA
jgi:hypothetical protein